MTELYDNKEAFLAKKPRKLRIFWVLLLIMIIFLTIFSTTTYMFDNYRTKGLVTCSDICEIKAYIPSFLTIDTLKLNNKKIDYKIINEEILVDEEQMISYKSLSITTKNLVDKEIVDLTFYYNKQRIIVKIKEKMF